MSRLILASGSSSRRLILERAGLDFLTCPSTVDEEPIKTKALSESLGVAETALLLSEAKAEEVSRRHPGLFVLGADQMLDCARRRLDKPRDITEAGEQLRFLRGRTHRLTSAMAVMLDGRAVWRHVEEARLTMRDFSDEFLEAYIAANREELLSTVGAYRLEGTGIQLFAAIEGEHTAILGLPLLPLLHFLRGQGIIPA